jgi:2-polyprenyl-3-methyl-5-hydroxy-6-metoxy-1,4-benzoquinol methylase
MKRCGNASCGLIWLDPMPVKEDIGKAYEDYYTHSEHSMAGGNSLGRRLKRAVRKGYLAHAYGYENDGSRALGVFAYLSPLRRAGLDFSVMYLPCCPGASLLEVGCGSGSMLKDMADLGWRAEGVDFDPVAVQNSRRKGLDVHLGTLEGMRYRENSFDAVIMSHVIEHVHDPGKLVKECHRILKPNGRLVLVTPNTHSIGHRLYGSSWFHLDPPRHLHIFTVGTLTKLLTEAGFHTTKMGTTVRDADNVYIASRSVRRTRRYDMGSTHPRKLRLWGKGMQAIEWAWLRFDARVGEEIALITQK